MEEEFYKKFTMVIEGRNFNLAIIRITTKLIYKMKRVIRKNGPTLHARIKRNLKNSLIGFA